jgi:transcriptional regulator with XRE-family HTH domain
MDLTMNEASLLIEELKKHYKIGTLQELSDKLGVAQNTISGWKQRNSINAIKRKIYELDLDIKTDNIQANTIDDEIEDIYSLMIDKAAYDAKERLLSKYENDIGSKLATYFEKDLLKEAIRDLASDKDKYTPHNMKDAFLERLKGFEPGIMKDKQLQKLSTTIEKYFPKIEVYALVRYPEIVFDYVGYFGKSNYQK